MGGILRTLLDFSKDSYEQEPAHQCFRDEPDSMTNCIGSIFRRPNLRRRNAPLGR